MLTNFFYTHPVWLVGIVVIGVWTGLSLLGLVIVNKFSSAEHRHKDTETVGLTYAIVAVVYAVLIGFIVVNVFESSAKGDEIATTEANKLSNLKSDSVGLSIGESLMMREAVNKYLDVVITKEWPAQQDGKLSDDVFEPGWDQIGEMSTKLAGYEPTTAGQQVTKAEMLHVMGDLVQARRNRIEAAGDHVPDVIWQILLLAGAVAVGYTYLFGAHSFKIHLAITGLIAATISLVFVLIIALDYPFRGEVSVSDEAFISVKNTRTVEPGSAQAKAEADYKAKTAAGSPETVKPETPKPAEAH
jgi:Protein of unknown function (DUF4239)